MINSQDQGNLEKKAFDWAYSFRGSGSMPARQGIRQQELGAYISDPKHEVEIAGFECRESFETSELAPGDTPPPQNYTPSLSHTVSPTEDQVFNRMSL